jgi:hypothetical protein
MVIAGVVGHIGVGWQIPVVDPSGQFGSASGFDQPQIVDS